MFPIMLILNVFASSFSDKFMKDILGTDAFGVLQMYLVSLRKKNLQIFNFPNQKES